MATLLFAPSIEGNFASTPARPLLLPSCWDSHCAVRPISAADLSYADRCLCQFYSQFTDIYGNNYGECEAFIFIAYTVQPEILSGETFLLHPLILLLCVN